VHIKGIVNYFSIGALRPNRTVAMSKLFALSPEVRPKYSFVRLESIAIPMIFLCRYDE